MLNSVRRLGRRLAAKLHPPSSKYIDDPVPMIAKPPYKFEGVTTFSYNLEVSSTAQLASSNLIDRYLNEPLGCPKGDGIYRAPDDGTRALVTFSSIEASFSEGDPNRRISYREVAVLMPVIFRDEKTGRNKTGYFTPILFIDGPGSAVGQDPGNDSWHATSPIVIGRELYGLPKVPARIDLQFSDTVLESVTVDMVGEAEPLMSAVSLAGNKSAESAHPRTSDQRLAMAESLFGKIRQPQEAGADQRYGVTEADEATVDLWHIGWPSLLIGLRQFRDPCHFAHAAGRAIVETSYEIDPPDHGWPLGNGVEINFSELLAAKLGLKAKYHVESWPGNGAVFKNICATFGADQFTDVRPAP